MVCVYNRGTKDRPNWWVKFKDEDGVWRRKATYQPSKEAAKRYAYEVAARIARGLVGIPERGDAKPALTVSALFERFLREYHGPKVRKLDRYRSQRKYDYRARVLPYSIATMAADKVRLSDVETWRDALRQRGYMPQTINDAVTFMKLVFNWSLRRELIDCRNPCVGVGKLPVEFLQERYTLEQVQRLLALPTLPVSVPLALYTGLRRGELLALRWTDIDFESNRIHVSRSYAGPTKSGKPRIVPLHRELKPILERWRNDCPAVQGLICPILVTGRYRAATVKDDHQVRALRAVLAKAGCPTDFVRPWHAFRHTFATHFLEQGGAQAALERILGHSTSGNQVTAIYLHVGFDFLARELGRMSYLKR